MWYVTAAENMMWKERNASLQVNLYCVYVYFFFFLGVPAWKHLISILVTRISPYTSFEYVILLVPDTESCQLHAKALPQLSDLSAKQLWR